MVWFVAEFVVDKSISKVSQKWLRTKNEKLFCHWPKKDVEKKNKEEADPDADPEEWTMHECRLLMHGGKHFFFHLANEIVSNFFNL